jgi:hypothetical protein
MRNMGTQKYNVNTERFLSQVPVLIDFLVFQSIASAKKRLYNTNMV